MPNPSEMYRTEIERTNQQLKKFAESRNALTQHHWICQELREARKALRNNYLPKKAKEKLLKQIRELEKQAGYPSQPYNSNDF